MILSEEKNGRYHNKSLVLPVLMRNYCSKCTVANEDEELEYGNKKGMDP